MYYIIYNKFLINLSSFAVIHLFPIEYQCLQEKCYEQQGERTAVCLSNQIISFFFFSMEIVYYRIVSLVFVSASVYVSYMMQK